MKLNDLKWISIYIALKTVMVPFIVLPQLLAIRAGAGLGGLLYHLLPKWRKLGIENITSRLPYLQAQPDWNCLESSPDAIIRQVFTNMGILIAELSLLNSARARTLLDRVEIRGLEYYEEARRNGRGIIGITAHSGNWELMALAFGLRITPINVVARTMKKDYFSKALEELRTRFGNKIIYRDNGVRDMLACLKANGALGLLPDQAVLPPHGILVDFFGRPGWTTFMPVKLAIKTGCPILPFFIHRENDRSIITIYPELKLLPTGSEEERILDGTIKMNLAIEQHVLKHPTQWNWLYRRWKGTEGLPAEMHRQNGADACSRA
jgi:KDO2-lipid IV(A) lauroyltransferase